jgi:hypothetical protein
MTTGKLLVLKRCLLLKDKVVGMPSEDGDVNERHHFESSSARRFLAAKSHITLSSSLRNR